MGLKRQTKGHLSEKTEIWMIPSQLYRSNQQLGLAGEGAGVLTTWAAEMRCSDGTNPWNLGREFQSFSFPASSPKRGWVFQWCCGFSIVISISISKLSPILLLGTPIRTWFPAAPWCHCYFDLLWVPFLEGVDPHVIHLPRKTLSGDIISLWELHEKSAKHCQLCHLCLDHYPLINFAQETCLWSNILTCILKKPCKGGTV